MGHEKPFVKGGQGAKGSLAYSVRMDRYRVNPEKRKLLRK